MTSGSNAAAPQKETQPAAPTRTGPLVPVLVVLGLFIALRLGLSVLGWFTLVAFPPSETWWSWVADGADRVLRPGDAFYYVLGPWQRGDALTYERIAAGGYGSVENAAAFFPLYPALMRLLGLALQQNWTLAGLVISGLSFVAGLLALWRLVSTEVDPTVATRAVVYLSIFPAAVFLFAPYAEALFLALAVASFHYARRGEPWPAGAFGFAAALTHPHGIGLLVPLAWEYGRQHGWRREALWSREAWHLAIVVLAPALFLTFVWLFTGGVAPLTQTPVPESGAIVRPPWETLGQSLRALLAWAPPWTAHLDLLVTLGFLALSALALRYLPPSYALLSFALLLPRLVIGSPQSPLLGASRLALVDFPCFILLAMAGRRRIVHRAYLAVALAGLLFFTAAFVWGLVA